MLPAEPKVLRAGPAHLTPVSFGSYRVVSHKEEVMRRSIHLCFAAIVTAAGCSTAGHVSAEPIYRYINVLDGTRVILGEPFRRTDLARRSNDSTFVLRPGTFGGGGTTEIRLGLDPAGILRIMTFVYDGSESLETKIADYTNSLGAPAERRALAAEGSVHVWQDAETRFELWWTPHQRPHFWSRLIDRRAERSPT
jgi:hypothetical protein